MSAKGIGAEIERLRAAPEWGENREKTEAGLVGEAARSGEGRGAARVELPRRRGRGGQVAREAPDPVVLCPERLHAAEGPRRAGGKREASREAWLDSRDQFLGAEGALARHEKETTGMLAEHRRRFAPQIEVLESEALARDAARELDEVAAGHGDRATG